MIITKYKEKLIKIEVYKFSGEELFKATLLHDHNVVDFGETLEEVLELIKDTIDITLEIENETISRRT